MRGPRLIVLYDFYAQFLDAIKSDRSFLSHHKYVIKVQDQRLAQHVEQLAIALGFDNNKCRHSS
ncbi:MAG: hypothetical protein PUP91_12535 [Rhizonema sp. PD37]|nr:hypothetical protein [Rhizonema sp. PD37]